MRVVCARRGACLETTGLIRLCYLGNALVEVMGDVEGLTQVALLWSLCEVLEVDLVDSKLVFSTACYRNMYMSQSSIFYF